MACPSIAADGSKITYTATEINVPNKYVKPQSQTFQLTEGQTASIHFENKLKRWRVMVTKSDDRTGSTPQRNGSLAGAKYGVYKGNELVKEYITDKDQTVEFEEPDKPQIKTKATVDGEKEVDPLEKVTLIDTVTYSNLTPGKTYTVKGVLMDKSTGKKLLIDGKEVTAETEFTPDKANGSVDLSFTFDASGLAGKSVVAFETLYHENIEVAVHADIDDDDQTVVIRQPKLKTTATIGGKKEAVISKELVLEDKVSYTGLTPGKEYTVKGVLMDKSTGKKFLVSGKEITAEATFTPEESEGEVTVTFKFDGSKITAKTDLVVFETLYRDGKKVAAHADINDEGQTVTLTPEKPKTPTPDVPKTGDGRSILLPLILLGGSIAGLLALFLFWFGRKKESTQTGSEKDQ